MFGRLANINCRRCWRPLDHCACDAPTLLAHDDAALTRLALVRARQLAGLYPAELDAWNAEQQRWAFLVWLDDHGKLAHD